MQRSVTTVTYIHITWYQIKRYYSNCYNAKRVGILPFLAPVVLNFEWHGETLL